MYTLALAILLGLAVASVTEIVYEVLPVVNKIKYIKDPNLMFPILAVLAVWVTDTSILGTYGLAGAEWFDVVGSGLAVASLSRVTDAVVEYLDKKV